MILRMVLGVKRERLFSIRIVQYEVEREQVFFFLKREQVVDKGYISKISSLKDWFHFSFLLTLRLQGGSTY